MTVVSSKEFAGNEDKYFDMALEEQVCIKRGKNMFLLSFKNVDDMNMYHEASVYDKVLEPDDDFYRAITGEELLERLIPRIEKLFSK
jgi:hypothetical protein